METLEVVTMDEAEPRLDKKISVLCSAAVIARRKRMEIRRFMKLARSMPFVNDNRLPVMEGNAIYMKRARVERAATTGSLFESLAVDCTPPSSWHTEEASFDPLNVGEDSANTGRSGVLCKSVSFGETPCVYGDASIPNAIRTGAQISVDDGQRCSFSTALSKDQQSERERDSSLPEEGCDRSSSGGCSSMDTGPESSQNRDMDSLATSNSSGSIVSGEETATSSLMVGRLNAETGENGTHAPEAMPSTQSSDCISFNQSRNCSCPPCGKLLICGRRREMEDMVTISPSFAQVDCGTAESCFCPGKLGDQSLCDLHFFAVYDGHGGSQASTYCRERLHHALAEELPSLCSSSYGDRDVSEGPSSSFTWEKAMEACFAKVDREVGGVCPNGECKDMCDGTSTCCGDSIAPENVGTTAVVAVISSCQILVANCGDSRAVLSRGGVAIPLSHDHKPERDDETSRIEAAGGRVIYWDGYRVGGLLALSRSIGDRYLKQYVVSEPDVTRLQRTDDDECLILASDGLWDVLSNDTVCEIARKGLNSSRKKRASGSFSVGEDPASSAVAALLVKLAYGRGSKDNISVVVIDLKL